LPLAEFCAQHGLDLEAAIAALASAGIPAKGEMTLKQIAQAAGRAPTDVYDLLRATTSARE
jgi:predicted transcriptional regulator